MTECQEGGSGNGSGDPSSIALEEKEREGKERKGKERKGKERKGKERKEMKGKER